MKSNGQDAVELGDMGFRVLPLFTWNVNRCDCNDKLCGTLDEQGDMIGSPAKHPRIDKWQHNAATDTETIVRWWGMWPSANIGVATGPESGIVVLDVDPRNGGGDSWLALREEHDYEHLGPVCITGGGGFHFYFKHPGGKVLSRSGKIGAGLDVKADGGYVVAPPSVHSTGASYVWVEGYAPWERELTDIPDWLLTSMQAPLVADRHVTAVAEHITKGGRNTTLSSLAGSMRNRGMGETAIFNALLAENEEKCEPPLDTREVARIAASISRYEPGVPSGPIILDHVVTKGKPGPERREVAYIPAPGTFADLQHKHLPATVWAVPRLLPQGCAMLAGAAKLGKSWWVLNLCFSIALGEQAFQHLATIEGDCLYLALEDGENRLKERTSMLMGEAQWPVRAWYETKWPRIDEGGKEALEAWLGQHPEARIVVIDTFVLFKPLDVGKSNKDIYAADYASVRAIKSIADEFGVCILLVTHLNKGEHADWVNGMTGSTGLSGSADTLLNLARPEGGRDISVKNEATLRLTGRDVEEQAWACKRNEQGWWEITGNASEVGEERISSDTVKAMQMLWEDGHTEVTATLLRTITNSTKASANKNLARAAAGGMVKRLSQGTYALLDSDRGAPIRTEFRTSFGQE